MIAYITYIIAILSQLLGVVDHMFLFMGLTYFTIWFIHVIRSLNDKNKKDEVRIYLTSFPAYLLVLDFALFGGVLGYLLTNRYSELFSSLVTLLGVLLFEGPLLIFTLVNLKKEEIKTVVLPILIMLFAVGYFTLFMSLIPWRNILMDKILIVINFALISVV